MMKRLFFLMLLPLLFACKKDNIVDNNPVRSVPVNLTVYPNDPLNFNVQAIGGWIYINGGINGIVLYRKSQEEFVAVERSSSYAPNDPKSKVYVKSDNFTLRDSISGSEWRMFDGTVTKGPAGWPLRLYGTSYDGNSVIIRN